MVENWEEYVDAGFRVFGLHGVTNGACECGNPRCEALYKHPIASGWQHTPDWSDEQLENMQAAGHFNTGFGVLCTGWLIIDVDARNGGVESYQRLCEQVPQVAGAGFVVETGSGGGSKHLYFKAPADMAMVQSLPQYKGIDFKTSGYVVGAGSMHASGKSYTVLLGSPAEVDHAPDALLALLKKPEYFRVSHNNKHLDVDAAHIAMLLSYIDPDCPYEQWCQSGMAVNHCLGGGGFEIWDEWSARGSKYPGSDKLDRHWNSFGKSANPVGYGTLHYYATENGYCDPVTFVYSEQNESSAGRCLLDEQVDLLRPPGFVGELTQWINDQCLYPREHLAVATALTAVSSLCGMRFVDELNDMTANIIAFCVAGSSTGKENVNQAFLKIMKAAGIQAAVHGGFKSEQELMRNLIRHQAAFYAIDELGITLRKVENATKRGGASYLEGLIGLIMSVYSKANGYLPITGDLKEEIKALIHKELVKVEKQIDEKGATTELEKEKARVMDALYKIDDGLDSPYLTILGYTTPVTFNDLMGFEQATNGFMARAMIFEDLETNPKRKKGFRKTPMDDRMQNKIRNLWAPGRFDMMERSARICFEGHKTILPTEQDAADLLDEVYERFYQMADEQKGATGLEAIPRRGYELTAKVSMILAMPSGVRTAEHVQWAYAIAKRDVEKKIKLAYSTEHAEEVNGQAAKVLSLISKDHGETLGVICNRMRSMPKEQVSALLTQMVDKGMLKKVDSKHPGNGRTVERYFSAT